MTEADHDPADDKFIEFLQLAPSCMTFLPTNKIMIKLLERAAQIQQPLHEINHIEAIKDPESTANGISLKLRALKVRPPMLGYPEVTDEDFYERLGCSQLRAKYDPNSDLYQIRNLTISEKIQMRCVTDKWNSWETT